jgi:transposase
MAKSSVAVRSIDLGENSRSLVGFDAAGTVIPRRRARCETIVGLTAKLSACVAAMEACCGAHHLGRLLAAQGAHHPADVARICGALCQGAR